jgi:tRNA pseudouridine38-40 synthase
MVRRLTISYRGTAYAGWQRQENAVAIQQRVEEAVQELAGEKVRVVGASRTDAGVHARGQEAHLALGRDLPNRALVLGLNHYLPEDIRILAAYRMAPDFHARKSAESKEYSYRMLRARVLSPLDAPFALPIDPRIDLESMRQACSRLPGEHDFSAFALTGGSHRSPVRHIFAAAFAESAGELRFRISGSGFLRGMVRSLVGTLLEVGSGRRGVEEFAGLLQGGHRRDAGPTAPPHALVLERVNYSSRWEDREASAKDPSFRVVD